MHLNILSSFHFQISVVFFGCCFVTINVSCQSITSSLEATDREYFCPGEVVTYVCTGLGSEISLFVPPQLPSGQQFSYFSSDAVGSELVRNQVFTNLSATNPFVVDLIVQNTSLTGLTIFCAIDSQNPVERAHVLSGISFLSGSSIL